MGRPAAGVGLALCALGTITQMGILSALHNAYVAYSQIPAQYRNPYQASVTTPYVFAWINFLISAASVLAFTNAMRGTLAYNQMVTMRRARDKQDALDSTQLSALRSRFSGVFSTSRRALATMQAKAQTAVVARTTSVPVESVAPVVPISAGQVSTREEPFSGSDFNRPHSAPSPTPIPFPA